MKLNLLMGASKVGTVEQNTHAHPELTYAPSWVASAEAVPLSMSLPLARQAHSTQTVSAVLWGLLPDNEATLDRWASAFHVSARNPLGMLAHVGEECAGAMQFVTDDRLDLVASGALDAITPLSDEDVAARLQRVRQDVGATRRPDDPGQFSLAGAQAKIALLHTGQGWALPSGRIPTTHILKPPSGDFSGYVENEMFCLALAREMGLPAASSNRLQIGTESAICVERYDRYEKDGSWFRLHQEDFCQALGVRPHLKYQNQGGPGPADLASVLWTHSSSPAEDVRHLFDALAFNYFIGGTDAHAKNYSLLIGNGGVTRLAPLYDISSALAYSELDIRAIRMAMRIGSHYNWWDIRLNDWVTLSEQLRLDPSESLKRMALMAYRLPDKANTVHRLMEQQDTSHEILHRLIEQTHNACERFIRRVQAAAA
ncbi:type II toxin-antitoxin system HipA family toxin [Stenotrophomonas sp. C3(2023)]|uniref:type II toxin-antitoxin system HipA family toxin n=1 Tax=Stenotrophomonas sp. C3(2023) TaxID=3080277 RepID=UPI00293C6982|nr:type II toxin-antitoxin system HipA family toxin [Stenotrophomonas sp. C3(2023)]MDV3467283.1 type II toxin-antitoxin system HipA family toxin [Stenotrophomonas sp. C3(2023)]